MPLILLALVVVSAIVFDVSSGMNDVSGMIAAPLVTGTLRVRTARTVVLAGVVCGPFLAAAGVARAYATGVVRLPERASELALWILILGLIGATGWNFFARARGWPTSSSHSLVGALVGAALVAQPHIDSVHWGLRSSIASHHLQGISKVVVALLLSPTLGGAVGWGLTHLSHRLLRRAHRRIVVGLRASQVVTLFAQGISYGMNDAQRTMGIVAASFLIAPAGGLAAFQRAGLPGVPTWVKLLSVVSIILGALIGSRSIARKIGEGVFRVRIQEALAAQVGATAVVFGASAVGGPVSSGQVLASAIVGAGSATRGKAVRWSAVVGIMQSWVVTIPGAAIVGALAMAIVRLLRLA